MFRVAQHAPFVTTLWDENTTDGTSPFTAFTAVLLSPAALLTGDGGLRKSQPRSDLEHCDRSK